MPTRQQQIDDSADKYAPIIEGTLTHHFPGIDQALIERATNIIARGFDPKLAESGTGTSLQGFAIATGRRLTHRKPEDLSDEELGEILKKIIY